MVENNDFADGLQYINTKKDLEMQLPQAMIQELGGGQEGKDTALVMMESVARCPDDYAFLGSWLESQYGPDREDVTRRRKHPKASKMVSLAEEYGLLERKMNLCEIPQYCVNKDISGKLREIFEIQV